jgi:phosphoglycolate phosphatase-like HAD superfamily hydrolase
MEEKIICNWCGQITTIVWVHGHGQCTLCGNNIEECCRGEQAEAQQNFFSVSTKEEKKLENIKHICFDLDGTLVDSSSTIYKATQATLQKLNIDAVLPEPEFVGMIGKHFVEIFDSLKLSIPDFSQFISVYKNIYFDFIDDSVLFPGVTEVLEYFKRKKIKTSILTTKAQDQADKIVDHFKLRKNLNYVMGRRDGIAHKPSSEPLLRICTELKINPDETLMVGDTELDIQCGKNAGTKTCGVLHGYRTHDQIEIEKPDYIVAELKELIEFF